MIVTHSASKVSVRRLEQRDIPFAMELSSGAGWNQLPEDWAALIELSPEGCFAVEIEGVLASTTTVVCYGLELAWIGMVLTRPEFRGRGYARILLERALALADERQVATVKLDATEQGMRLYNKLGFRKEQMVERWTGWGLPPGDRSRARQALNAAEEAEELDRRATGARRGLLLRLLAERSQLAYCDGGFAMQRAGRVTRYLGPCAALDETSAQCLIEDSLQCDTGRWSWDILSANAAAARIAASLGFKVERQLTRMVRGPDLVSDSSLLFAIAGFEVG